MSNSVRLARIYGIEIGIHYSWLIVFALITWSFAGGYFPAAHPEFGAPLSWLLALVTSLVFFAAVLAHELGQALVSLRLRVPERSITLFIFGGVASGSCSLAGF